jgi:hypothetical protein
MLRRCMKNTIPCPWRLPKLNDEDKGVQTRSESQGDWNLTLVAATLYATFSGELKVSDTLEEVASAYPGFCYVTCCD